MNENVCYLSVNAGSQNFGILSLAVNIFPDTERQSQIFLHAASDRWKQRKSRYKGTFNNRRWSVHYFLKNLEIPSSIWLRLEYEKAKIFTSEKERWLRWQHNIRDKANTFHAAVRLLSNWSQMTWKCGENKHVSLMFLPRWRLLWSVTEQTHGNMECIWFISLRNKNKTTSITKSMYSPPDRIRTNQNGLMINNYYRLGRF